MGGGEKGIAGSREELSLHLSSVESWIDRSTTKASVTSGRRVRRVARVGKVSGDDGQLPSRPQNRTG